MRSREKEKGVLYDWHDWYRQNSTLVCMHEESVCICVSIAWDNHVSDRSDYGNVLKDQIAPYPAMPLKKEMKMVKGKIEWLLLRKYRKELYS